MIHLICNRQGCISLLISFRNEEPLDDFENQNYNTFQESLLEFTST